ncbi:MAG TPA: hypothetical protein VE993_09690 [Stellaceae bacterium]|nr:hypothetical protein [Stellaceae bacterium]
MRTTIGFGVGLMFAFCALAALAAPQAPTHKAVPHGAMAHRATAHRATHKAAAHRMAAKGPPACAAISYRPLPAGAGDGEQQAGIYKSRFVTLALRAEVKGGQASDYYVVAGDKRLADAGAVPEAVARCAAVKKLPPPKSALAPCAGERFRVLVAHSGKERLAALYALDGNTWRFCNAGTF